MASDNFLEMSVELAKAHLASSPMDPDEIPGLIQKIYKTLQDLSGGKSTATAVTDPAQSKEKVSTDGLGMPQVIDQDISGPDFEGLDPWLAARLPRRTARKLNRDEAIHPSVFPDYLICLEDGAKVKLIRPYIRKRFGLGFAEYLDRWNLPDDYPNAPPAYLKAKRAAAKAAGFGYVTRGKRGSAKPLAAAPSKRGKVRESQ